MTHASEEMPRSESEEVIVPENPPEAKTEIQEAIARAEKLVVEKVAATSGDMDVQLASREQRYREEVQGAGSKDIEALKALEQAANAIRLKLASLKQQFKRGTLLLLPLAFGAKLNHAEIQPEMTAFSQRATAAEQLKRDGITDERKNAHTPGVSEFLYRGIKPYRYRSTWEIVKSLPKDLLGGLEAPSKLSREQAKPEREDAWRLYLGLPQEHSTFGISEYKPANSKEDKYYYNINGWFEAWKKQTGGNPIELFNRSLALREKLLKEGYDLGDTLGGVKGLEYDKDVYRSNQLEKIEEQVLTAQQDKRNRLLEALPHEQDTAKKKVLEIQILEIDKDAKALLFLTHQGGIYPYLKSGEGKRELDNAKGVMGTFTLTEGKDEHGQYISYYDKWDLDMTAEGEGGLLGKPFEIYDRIYYDPNTFEAIPESQKDSSK